MPTKRNQDQINTEIDRLLSRIKRLEANSPYGHYVPCVPRKTSPAWNGAAFSTTTSTLINLSAVFGIPTGVTAVDVMVIVRDSASASGFYHIRLSGESPADGGKYFIASEVNDRQAIYSAIIPCNSDGNIYYMNTASGTNTMDIWLQIFGYWIKGA